MEFCMGSFYALFGVSNTRVSKLTLREHIDQLQQQHDTIQDQLALIKQELITSIILERKKLLATQQPINHVVTRVMHAVNSEIDHLDMETCESQSTINELLPGIKVAFENTSVGLANSNRLKFINALLEFIDDPNKKQEYAYLQEYSDQDVDKLLPALTGQFTKYKALWKQKTTIEKSLQYENLVQELTAATLTGEAVTKNMRNRAQALIPYIQAEVNKNPLFINKAVDIIQVVTKLLNTQDANGQKKFVHKYRVDHHYAYHTSKYSINYHDAQKLIDQVNGGRNEAVLIAATVLIALALLTLFIGLLLLSPKASAIVALAAPLVCYCALGVVMLGLITLAGGAKRTGFSKRLSDVVDARGEYENNLSDQQARELSAELCDSIYMIL